jgi:hypothetical protein
MVHMEEHIELYENQIEILKGGSSSSHVIGSTYPTDGLLRVLADLNLKGVKIEKMKKTISTLNEEIKDKDKFIG